METVMDWITFGIAVAGFLMSLASWVRTLWKERKHLDVSIDFNCDYGCAFFSSRGLNAVFAIRFENKSTNSIAVTYVEIMEKSGASYRANLAPGYVFLKRRRDPDPSVGLYERVIESAKFPIEICGLGAAYEYVQFLLPREVCSCDVVAVVVHTNRGDIFINTVEVICTLQEFLQRSIREKFERQEDPLQSEETL